MTTDRMHKRIAFGCSCGHVARSAIGEAIHRHNFPLFCKKKKGVKRETAKQTRKRPINNGRDTDEPEQVESLLSTRLQRELRKDGSES